MTRALRESAQIWAAPRRPNSLLDAIRLSWPKAPRSVEIDIRP
jgi:hypothetical protein